jgi:hypothetical protein
VLLQVADLPCVWHCDSCRLQAETAHIVALEGATVQIDKPLIFMHFGQFTFGVDQRAEVRSSCEQVADPFHSIFFLFYLFFLLFF